MATITLEQIDLIMQRANVSYAEAKEALELANGDIVEALLLLEKKGTITSPPRPQDRKDKINDFIHTLNSTYFVMKKNDKTYINVPLSVAAIGIIASMHVSIIALVISLIMGVKIHIIGENEIASKLNDAFSEFRK